MLRNYFPDLGVIGIALIHAVLVIGQLTSRHLYTAILCERELAELRWM